MTESLQKAFAEVSRLPMKDQDAFARWLLRELEDDQRWSASFAAPADRLAGLALEARKEHAAGRTRKLDLGGL
jgi:hypothetical protein